MKVRELVEAMGLTVFGGASGLEREIEGGYVSDLLSDVMGNSDEGHVWVTLQAHRNVVGIAGLKDLAAVIIVKGFIPDADTMADSKREGIPLLGSTLETFDVAGTLHRLLVGNADISR